MRPAALLLALAIALPSFAGDTPTVVVTTSLLEEAVRELSAALPEMKVVRLVPPASAPGHFDLGPRLLPDLRAASLILRHADQAALDTALLELGGVRRSVAARTTGSPLVPEHYATLVEGVADQFARTFPDRAPALGKAAAATRERVTATGERLKRQAAALAGQPVIASPDQRAFLEWLGLAVAGEVPRPDAPAQQELRELPGRRARLVVADLQEGSAAAQALGVRMELPVAVLSSFPGVDGFGSSYDDLVEGNLRALTNAMK